MATWECGQLEKNVKAKEIIIQALHDNFSEFTEDQASAVIEALKLEGFVLIPKDCSDDMAEIIATTANVCGGIAGDVYDAILKQAMIKAGAKSWALEKLNLL